MDACPNCGYCKHCGRSDKPEPVRFVPAPYPVYPVYPTWPPYVWTGDGSDFQITWGNGTGAARYLTTTTSHM